MLSLSCCHILILMVRMVRIVSGLILLFVGLLFACLFVWISFHSSFSVASVVPGGRLFAECQPTRCSLQQQPSTVHFSKEYCNSVLTNCKCIIVQCTIGCITVHLMHCDRVNHIMTQSVNPLSASRSCCDPYASTPILTHLTRTNKCFLELIVGEFFFRCNSIS